MMTRALICSLILLSLASCAFAPVSRPNKEKIEGNILRQISCESDPATALPIASEALRSMGYEILWENKELFSILTKDKVVDTTNICDCGKWNFSKVNGTAITTIEIQIEPNKKGGSIINITPKFKTTFTGRNLFGLTTRTETYECASTGKLETEFWQMFSKLASLKPSH